MLQRGAGQYFAGKRCFVTGAASGIGRATALRLAAQGAELYLTDRDRDGLAQTVCDARALGAQVPEHRVLDVSDYQDVAAFAADIHARHPSMDVVLNIAGVSAWGTVDQLTHDQWSRMVAINLMGPIHVIETLVPPMVAAGRGGHLVNVSSAAGLVGLPWHAAYSASKYGLRGLSEVLRFDLARHGRGVGRGAWRRQDPAGQYGRDRRSGSRRPEGQPLGRTVQWSRRDAGEGGRQNFGRGHKEQIPGLYVGGHPGAVCVQAICVVAIHPGDATSQRVLHARASARAIAAGAVKTSRRPGAVCPPVLGQF